jgi:hypothetical protein
MWTFHVYNTVHHPAPGVSVSTRWMTSISIATVQDAFFTDPMSIVLSGTFSVFFGRFVTGRIEKLITYILGS